MNRTDRARINEKALEDVAVASLNDSPLFRERPAQAFDAARLLDVEETVAFIQATQPKERAKLSQQFPGAESEALAGQIAAIVQKRGTLEALRNGVSFNGVNVHFAVDDDAVFMTTRVAGAETAFLPFNRDTRNPIIPERFASSYLWDDFTDEDGEARTGILRADSLLLLIQNYQLSALRTRREDGPGAVHLPALSSIDGGAQAAGARARKGERAQLPDPAQRGFGQIEQHRVAGASIGEFVR
jgi:hypothetical protein